MASIAQLAIVYFTTSIIVMMAGHVIKCCSELSRISCNQMVVIIVQAEQYANLQSH